MIYKCRVCAAHIAPSENQIKKSNFICKQCSKEYDREYRERRRKSGDPVKSGRMPLEYHREYNKKYICIDRVKKAKRLSAAQRRKDPLEVEKMRCRRKTRSAIESGLLVKMPCEVCGNDNVDAHHDDYGKPLAIKWLCRFHHSQLHAKAKGE